MPINKVRVFISSKCDNKDDIDNGCTKYGVMRKSVKLLLEQTNICDVFVFEEGHSTSYNVEASYMNHLEDSDLVILIIDNTDGVSIGTQKEINRARALNKKCVYVFCDEREKNPTELQQELMSSVINPRFCTVHEFSDIPEKAYNSVIDDILSIYTSYCRGRIDYISTGRNQLEGFGSNSIDITLVDDNSISKEFISEFPFTKYLLKKEAGLLSEEQTSSSGSDFNCACLLGQIIGSSLAAAPNFVAIKKDIKLFHKGNVQRLISLRYEAVESYFSGDLVLCCNKLKEALNYIETCKNIPKWLLNDVALDLRNVQTEIDREKDILTLHTNGQDILNQDNEPLYYPVIDRFVSDYYKEIIKPELFTMTNPEKDSTSKNGF